MRIALLFIAVLFLGCQRPASTPAGDVSAPSQIIAEPTPIEATGLHNAFRVSDRIYSGSSPDGDAGFAELERLNIKTIISVDGSRPDVDAARRHGMAYVHLPFGYDGIPRERILELAKAAATVAGPIYVHCHHGQHRGPAAVAAIQMCLDPTWSADRAAKWLRTAGTDRRYTGLVGLPRTLVPPTADELASLPAEFPPVAETGCLTQAMVALDGGYDQLKIAKSSAWSPPRDHPDIDPAHEALMVIEFIRETGRLENVKRRGREFLAMLHEAESAAIAVEAALRVPSIDRPWADSALSRLEASCTHCHSRFRDRPADR